jgi:hypothetical protein
VIGPYRTVTANEAARLRLCGAKISAPGGLERHPDHAEALEAVGLFEGMFSTLERVAEHVVA